jgi:hypothetical protein
VPLALRRPATLLALALLIVGCSTGGPAFDPAGPCTTDGQVAGAYPILEALVPKQLAGRGPDRLDSGRSCSESALATLKAHGVTELRFGGGLWELGKNSGTALVVFDSPVPLQSDWLAELYEAGARAARNTSDIKSSTLQLGAARAFRLDTLNDDSYQTVVVWTAGSHVVAALVGSSVHEVPSRDAHEQRVGDALTALGANPFRR